MEKLILNYETWNNYHPIIRAALLHGELVKIHPFVDGNGRTSRLLMNLDLMNSGYNPVIIKKEDRLKYYESLDKAHTTGNYTDFVKLVTKLEVEMLKKYLELLQESSLREKTRTIVNNYYTKKEIMLFKKFAKIIDKEYMNKEKQRIIWEFDKKIEMK